MAPPAVRGLPNRAAHHSRGSQPVAPPSCAVAHLVLYGSIFPGQGPIEEGERAYSRVRGQSKKGSEHIPGSGANRRRGASSARASRVQLR
eukprot:7918349-Pyramimonas_sp.AAC.1